MAPVSIPEFEIGSVIADTYEIERELGRGGMGVVLLARHLRLPSKRVAIKVLQAQLAGEELLARFKREAHIISVLAHPNIVHVEDYNVTPDGTPYLVLEYLPGESLAERLERGALDIELAMSIARQIGSALAAAHAHNIIHRDLKPGNVLLVPTQVDGHDATVAKVLDFGISKMLDSDTVKTTESSLLGTPQYMAPEQATGQTEAIGVRTDVFALGTIVYEMLNGRPAFTGASVPEVVFKAVYEQPAPLPSSVPESVASAIRQAMAKVPAERFSSVPSFIEALTGRRVSSPTTPPPAVTTAATSAKVARVDELASTVDSANLPGATLAATARTAAPTTRTAAPRRARTMLIGAIAILAIAAIVVALAMRSPERHQSNRPGPERLREVASQLTAGDDVVLDGKKFHVDRTDGGLRIVKFEVNEHPFEAVEQNPNKKSRWAQLAREGHTVVQFRDLETGRYFAVVVDGEPKRIGEGEPINR